MRQKLFLAFLAAAVFLPCAWRLMPQPAWEPAGFCSDLACGLILFSLAAVSPRPLRLPFLLLWAMYQVGAQELLAAMQRLPDWHDFHYLADPAFVGASASGLHFSSPYLTAMLLVCSLAAGLWPSRAVGGKKWYFVAALVLFGLHYPLSRHFDSQTVAARYNPLHWLAASALAPDGDEGGAVVMPSGLTSLDLSGPSILGEKRAKNLLIITMEGIPGIYHPEIHAAFAAPKADISMDKLAAETADAMLIPDFVAHSHQTIRGLYALLCGDFSKQSWDTPKAYELQGKPQRAGQCLPAQMTAAGFSTHFLQGANLNFMGKDWVMPMLGFQEVHGKEWFTEKNPFPFDWGVVDEVFFRGAANYIATLEKKGEPWMLTLLTVGTHQPYAAPDKIADRYPNRKLATVALLDQAVADFVKTLRGRGILENTLVFITSDESHGADQADWVSSWGTGIVLIPGEKAPRLKSGGYGLVDTEASVLDYFSLPMPPAIIGRSFFRDYDTPREMVSFTASKRRWHDAAGIRHECTEDGLCQMTRAASILGTPDQLRDDQAGKKLFAIDARLDRDLKAEDGQNNQRRLQFAQGELRRLPAKVRDDWTDNLSGAQYLDFPAGSEVQVAVRVKAMKAPKDGVRLRLLAKQWEHDQKNIPIPDFPVLHTGEECLVEFSFKNPEARQSFSFHLLGEGKNALIRMDEFTVTVTNPGQSS
ncbi:MAG: LTA synthase family protein [Desulfobulbaceae bacterium]|nr:LTA synthase family protein [Desulfobulbaceae bacterium]